MPTQPHFDRIVAELSIDARAVLEELRTAEIAAGGFVHDQEVKFIFGFLEPRVERIVHALVGKTVQRYQDMTIGDIVEMINNLRQEQS